MPPNDAEPVDEFDPLELRDLRYRGARLRAYRAGREWELRAAGMSARQARSFARYETEILAMASDVVYTDAEPDPTREALTAQEAAFSDRILLTREDRARYIEIRDDDAGRNPWRQLGLEKGWLAGSVEHASPQTWQGAFILGVAPTLAAAASALARRVRRRGRLARPG